MENDTGGTNMEDSPTVDPETRSDVGSASDVGRIGGGQTDSISTGGILGSAGTRVGSGGTGGSEPTDTGNEMGMDTIGAGLSQGSSSNTVLQTGGAAAGGDDTVASAIDTGRGTAASPAQDTLGGVGGTGVGTTGTGGGTHPGALGGGTGDIGGMGVRRRSASG